MTEAGYPQNEDLYKHKEGFVTNEGRILNRVDAAKRAVETNLTKPIARRAGRGGAYLREEANTFPGLPRRS